MAYKVGSKYWYLPHKGKYTTSTGLRICDFVEFMAAKLGLVSYRRYAAVAFERNRFISELHWMAIQLNKMEDENRDLKYKLSRSPYKKKAFR